MRTALRPLSAFIVAAAFALPAAGQSRVTTDRAPSAVSVWTDLERYDRGDWAVVHLALREDGYVVVFQVDADGRGRVIFPAAPAADDFLRGDEDMILGKGEEGTFQVEGSAGTGVVYAAYSSTPFEINKLADGDRWSVIQFEDPALATDPLAALTSMVERMSSGRFQFDVARYEVNGRTSYVLGWDSGFSYGGSDSYCGYGYGYPTFGYAYECGTYLGYTGAFCTTCRPPIPIVPLPPIVPPSPPPSDSFGGPKTAPRIPVKEPPRFDQTPAGAPGDAGDARRSAPGATPVVPPRTGATPARPGPTPPPPLPPRYEPPHAPPPAPPPPAPRHDPPPSPPPAPPAPITRPPAPPRPPRS